MILISLQCLVTNGGKKCQRSLYKILSKFCSMTLRNVTVNGILRSPESSVKFIQASTGVPLVWEKITDKIS